MTSMRSLLAVSLAAAVAAAARGGPPTPAGPGPAAVVQDVLAAEEAGLVSVTFIPNDSRSAQVIVANRTERLLTLRLPAGFAGVPVLAQMMNQGNAGGFGAGGIGGTPQNVGGGGVQNAGMGIGGGMGGNFCWVAREVYGPHDPRWVAFRDWMEEAAPAAMQVAYATHGEDLAGWLHGRPVARAFMRCAMDAVVEGRVAEHAGGGHLAVAPEGRPDVFAVAASRSRVVRVATVCLEYGKREPSPRIAYRMTPLDACTRDPRVQDVVAALATGVLTQKTAQAAAWHLASGRTWEQLAAEVVSMAGGDPDVPVFSPAELAVARRFVDDATRRHPPESGGTDG